MRLILDSDIFCKLGFGYVFLMVNSRELLKREEIYPYYAIMLTSFKKLENRDPNENFPLD